MLKSNVTLLSTSNIRVVRAGVSGCPTLFQGVKSGGLAPRVRGITPTDSLGNPVDFGFDVAANFVQVDGFQIENTGFALGVEAGMTNAVLSNNDVRLATNGYGVLINAATAASVNNNTISAGTSSPLFAIADSPPSLGTVMDSNKIIGSASQFGIYTDGNSPVIQRNIVTGNFIGIWLAGTTGTGKLYNNTVDSNVTVGIHADTSGTGTVQSRNNIITRNTTGFESNTGGINSDYEDVFSNFAINSSDGSHIDQNYRGVVRGSNSISADPLFIQTNDPTQSSYYRLNSGSPCINRGTNVGLPFLGTAPDIGAVESQ